MFLLAHRSDDTKIQDCVSWISIINSVMNSCIRYSNRPYHYQRNVNLVMRDLVPVTHFVFEYLFHL